MSRKKQKNKNREIEEIPVSKTLPKEENNLFDFLKGKEFYIALLLISAVAFFVFRDFLLFKKAMMYKDIGSDSVNASYPPIVHLADYIRAVGIPSWSFNYGMGQNMFPFFLRDPFDLILYIIGKANVAYGIGYVEFLKVILGGIIFFFYLRTLEIKKFSCIVGALLYSFTGFMILGGGWYIFSSEAVMAALLLLAFEKLYKQNSWYLFPLAIAAIGLSMPFNLYVYGLFLCVYACLRFFETDKKFELKEFLGLFGKMILYGLIGVAISSFFLFENVLQLIESPRGSGGNSLVNQFSSAPMFAISDYFHNISFVFRMFSDDILGSGINYQGWHNYLESPIIYCGILCLVVLPQAFPFFTKRQKIVYSLFIAVWILPVIFPYFRYAFWLFTGDYYRTFSFFISLTFILLTVKALSSIENFNKINLPVLIGTTIVLYVLILYPYFPAHVSPLDKGILGFIKIIIIVYSLLIYALSVKKIKGFAQLFLLLAVCIELAYMSNFTVNRRSIVSTRELNEKVGYNDYTNEAADFLKKRDKSFFRIDKSYSSGPAIHASKNDGLAQDYYGTTSYNPFNQEHFIYFLQAFGIVRKEVETDSRWAQGLNGKPILESIGNVKYYINKKSENNPGLKISHDSIGTVGDVVMYQSKYYLPFGFTYENYFTHSEFEKLSMGQRQFTMLKMCFVEDENKNDFTGINKLGVSDTIPLASYTWDEYKNQLNQLKVDTLTIEDRGQTFFKATIELKKKKLLFLSIPFDKGWKAKVDDVEQEIKIIDAGMSGLILDKGKHKIELEFAPRYMKKGLIVSLVALAIYGFLIWRSRKKKIIEA